MMWAPGEEGSVRLAAAGVELEGHLRLPAEARGFVILALGSSAGRFGRRIQEIARVLQLSRLGTFITDLLTPEEDRRYTRRFDIPCLADRLLDLARGIHSSIEPFKLRLGVLSTSTGASAALWGAACSETLISAVVACEGRLDLVEELLADVHVPTLLVAGSRGGEITRQNAQTYSRIDAPKDMIVVPGAASVFEEPFARSELARWAAQWFECFLPPSESR